MDVALSTPVWLFALTLGLGTGVLFGLFPAVHGVRTAAAQGLRTQSARTSGSRAVVRFRATLATLQTALATALLALAGFSLVSLASLGRVELGIERDGLIVFGVSPYLSGYPPDRTAALVDELEETLRVLPGTRAVATTTIPILAGWDSSQNLTVEGVPPDPGIDASANRAAIGPDYFRTLGIPLIAGREFARTDIDGSPRVAIVNEAFARKFHLGAEAVGKRFGLGQGSTTRLDIEIVGLVRNAAYSSVREPPPPQFFLPHRQAERGAPTYFFYVRGVSATWGLIDAIPPLVGRLAPNVPVINLRTMQDQIGTGMSADRLAATFTSAFAALATLLAGVGLYAVLAYGVARRRRELGIRIALGATSGSIRRSVLVQVGRVTAAGAVLGSGAAVVLARVGESFLFGLEGAQPGVLAGAVAAVVIVTIAAAILPVRRAVSVNPVEALRAE